MIILSMDDVSFPDSSTGKIDFYESPFFHGSSPVLPQLPSPAAVRKEWNTQGRHTRAIKFEHLKLAVKFGRPTSVKLEEAQTMRAIHQAFPNKEVPVPELFGWRVDQGDNFIYMSLVEGSTLRETWELLTQNEKVSLRDQLGQMVVALRQLRQDPKDQFIGSVSRGPVQDLCFHGDREAGPFPSVRTFSDWIQLTALRLPMSQRPSDPYRAFLPDLCDICFTHGDLNLGNVMVSGDFGARRITAIIDWEQAGWYPEYWEYCKALIAEPYWHEWRAAGWSDTFMKIYQDEWVAFSEYWTWKRP
ncbi:kinase-like protein [Hypoxylon cercidicola]|nr:kinase-like protein [Hypoxylon cercidicola]